MSLAFRAQFCAKNEASERDAVAVAGFFRANGEISRTRAGSFKKIHKKLTGASKIRAPKCFSAGSERPTLEPGSFREQRRNEGKS